MNRDTREKIILSAAAEFARAGFHKTTIRTICRKAGVNVAAVNYHFKSKKILYKEVFSYLHKQIIKTDFDNMQISNRIELEKNITKFIAKLFDDINSEDFLHASLNRIMFWEMISPSSVFPSIYREYIKPFFDSAEKLFAQIFDSNVSALDIKILVFSVVSQCLFYSQNRVVAEKALGVPLAIGMDPNLKEKIICSIVNSVIKRSNLGVK
ncbi:MAG: TetR/AcrR family transcriptional regulator [Candidatus Nanoarchaeia archaeon]